MEIFSIAQDGLRRAEGQFEKTAQSIANHTVPHATTEPDSVSLSDPMVSLLESKQDYEANLNSLKVADEMAKKTLDLIG